MTSNTISSFEETKYEISFMSNISHRNSRSRCFWASWWIHRINTAYAVYNNKKVKSGSEAALLKMIDSLTSTLFDPWRIYFKCSYTFACNNLSVRQLVLVLLKRTMRTSVNLLTSQTFCTLRFVGCLQHRLYNKRMLSSVFLIAGILLLVIKHCILLRVIGYLHMFWWIHRLASWCSNDYNLSLQRAMGFDHFQLRRYVIFSFIFIFIPFLSYDSVYEYKNRNTRTTFEINIVSKNL